MTEPKTTTEQKGPGSAKAWASAKTASARSIRYTVMMLVLSLCTAALALLSIGELYARVRMTSVPVDVDMRAITAGDALFPEDAGRVRIVNGEVVLLPSMALSYFADDADDDAVYHICPVIAAPDEWATGGDTRADDEPQSAPVFQVGGPPSGARELDPERFRVYVVVAELPASPSQAIAPLREGSDTGVPRPAYQALDASAQATMIDLGVPLDRVWLVDTVTQPPPVWRVMLNFLGLASSVGLLTFVVVRQRRRVRAGSAAAAVEGKPPPSTPPSSRDPDAKPDATADASTADDADSPSANES